MLQRQRILDQNVPWSALFCWNDRNYAVSVQCEDVFHNVILIIKKSWKVSPYSRNKIWSQTGGAYIQVKFKCIYVCFLCLTPSLKGTVVLIVIIEHVSFYDTISDLCHRGYMRIWYTKTITLYLYVDVW